MDDPEKFLRAIFDEVVITLKSKWSGVEALAKVLLKEVTISEEELQEFFESENGNERMTY